MRVVEMELKETEEGQRNIKGEGVRDRAPR